MGNEDKDGFTLPPKKLGLPEADDESFAAMRKRGQERLEQVRNSPLVPTERRDTRPYFDGIAEAKETALASMVGRIVHEAGTQVERLVARYSKDWRMKPEDVVEAVHETASMALEKPHTPELLSDQNRDTFDTFRGMQGRFSREIADAGLMGGEKAAKMVADLVHNEFSRKETAISQAQSSRKGA